MFWKNEEEDDDKVAENLSKGIENLADRRTLFFFLIFCGVSNAIIWLCVILFGEWIMEVFLRVADVNEKLSAIILGIPFGLGTFFVYSLFRLKFPDIEDQNAEFDVMGSYNYQNHSTKRRHIWLVSIVGGVFNVLLLVFADIYFSNDF